MPDRITHGSPERRRRYSRSASVSPTPLLTPAKWEMLRYLAELRFLSLPQLARLCCSAERRDLSERSARRHLRSLFDAGLVDVLPVSRAALAPPDAGNDASLLHGSAPNVYAPTREGLRLLARAGHGGEELLKQTPAAYGPRNGLFLAHELLVRDVRVWLETCARSGGHAVERWEDGEAAAIGLGRDTAPFSVRPDAWFALRMGAAVLVGLVEVDRGTERGERHWREKLVAYAALYAGGGLKKTTGYVNARVLVLTATARRRDALVGRVVALARDVGVAPVVLGRVWLTEQGDLGSTSLAEPVWRRPGDALPRPLLPADAGRLTYPVPGGRPDGAAGSGRGPPTDA